MKRSFALLLLFACSLTALAAGGCSSAKSPEEAEHWTCPMHPTYVTDHPGTCPICNMDLVKQSKAPETPVDADAAGLATVGGSPESLRRAGVVTAVAAVGRLTRSVRAAGSVVADERRQVRAQSKISGWVEKLAVNATGLYVHKGAPAMSVYSPALLAAQSDYLLARDAANRFAGSQLPEVRDRKSVV